MEKYFLDSYALIEIIRENKNFALFEKTENFTGFMNLLEIHYIISRELGAQKADMIIGKLKHLAIHEEILDIRAASEFRMKNSKNKFSYIDCLGYSMALNREMKFVTGDIQFKNFENVEFVK